MKRLLGYCNLTTYTLTAFGRISKPNLNCLVSCKRRFVLHFICFCLVLFHFLFGNTHIHLSFNTVNETLKSNETMQDIQELLTQMAAVKLRLPELLSHRSHLRKAQITLKN